MGRSVWSRLVVINLKGSRQRSQSVRSRTSPYCKAIVLIVIKNLFDLTFFGEDLSL